MVKHMVCNLDSKLSLRAPTYDATMANSLTGPIRQPFGNGTNPQFELYTFWGIVNIVSLIEGPINRIQDLQHLVWANLFWEMDCWPIDTQMAYLQEHLLMPGDDSELQWLVSKLLQQSSSSHLMILATEVWSIWLPPWAILLPQL